MAKLTKKQKLVMGELFEGADEDDVLAGNNVSRRLFEKWCGEDAWLDEFDRRVEAARRRSQIIITTFQPAAAAKLVELTNCDKEQTARQACLDIIQMAPIVAPRPKSPAEISEGILEGLSDETAGELTAVLAKEGAGDAQVQNS